MFGLGRPGGGKTPNAGGTGYAGDDKTDKKLRAMGREQAQAQEAQRAEARHQLLSNQAKYPGVDPTEEVLTILRQTLRNFGVVAESGRRSASCSALDYKMLKLVLQISKDIMTIHPKKLGELYGRDDSLVLALQDSAKTAQLKVNHSEGSSAQELKVAKEILELFPAVKRASLKTHAAPDILVTDAKENYRQALRPFAFAFCESLSYHHFSSRGATSSSNHNASVLTAAQRKRLFQELSSYQSNLPIEFGSSILVRAMEGGMDHLRVLIFGPEDTPYANGCFLFDLLLNDYPRKAPKCQFLTTGGGRYRFNPNLYASGKVCLSLLGTWAGPSWQPNESTLYQLLISIQSLILGESEPYFNEPGVEVSRNTPTGQEQSAHYNRTIREYTCAVAILPFLNDATATATCTTNNSSKNSNLYPEFQEAIDLHFRLKQGALLRQLEEWNRDRPPPVCGNASSRGATSRNTTPPMSYIGQCLERLQARSRTSLIDHGEVELVMVDQLGAPSCSSGNKKRPRTMRLELGGVERTQEVISLDDDDNDGDQGDAKPPALLTKRGSIVTPLSKAKGKEKRKEARIDSVMEVISVLDEQDSCVMKDAAKSQTLAIDKQPGASSSFHPDVVFLLDDED